VFEQRGVVGVRAGIGHARTVRAAGRRRMGDAPVPRRVFMGATTRLATPWRS
jgi:hypothetical protein